MDEEKTIASTATNESTTDLEARIAELETTIALWEKYYDDEKEKQERHAELTKALMAFVATIL